MQTMIELPDLYGSPKARTAFCATWMSASCDSLLRVSTAFKLGLLTFRSANVKGTACLQQHEAVSQEGHTPITNHASGLLAYKGLRRINPAVWLVPDDMTQCITPVHLHVSRSQ